MTVFTIPCSSTKVPRPKHREHSIVRLHVRCRCDTHIRPHDEVPPHSASIPRLATAERAHDASSPSFSSQPNTVALLAMFMYSPCRMLEPRYRPSPLPRTQPRSRPNTLLRPLHDARRCLRSVTLSMPCRSIRPTMFYTCQDALYCPHLCSREHCSVPAF